MKIFNIVGSAKGKTTIPIMRVMNKESDGPVEILVYDVIGQDPWDGKGFCALDFIDATKDIDPMRELHVRFNSRGGEVNEGITLYNRIREWKGPTVGIVDGAASSIASVSLMGAKEIRMPKSGEIMIHEPWTVAMGNADDMRKTIESLELAGDRIAGIYAERTGKTKEEMREYMRATTVFSGETAKEAGLCDVVTDAKPLYNLSQDDISRFRRVPAAPAATAAPVNQTAAPSASANQNTANMNRKQIMALLEKRGVKVADDATDEQLFALLDAELNSKPAAAQPGADQNTADLRNAVVSLQKAYDRERSDRITREVDQLILDERIPVTIRDKAIARAIKDESVMDEYRALPPKPPGVEPINPMAQISADASNKDIVTELNRCNEPIRGWQRGINVAMEVIRNAALKRATFIQKFAGRLQEIWNTNTIDSTLKQDVILQDIIRDFAKRLLPLRAFSTVFQNVPLAGTKTVQVPYYDLDSTASVAFVAATGYTFGNTTTDNRPIIVGLGATDGGRYFQSMSFTSEELNFQPYFNVVQLARMKAEKLAYDIVTAVLGVVTATNFGAASITKQAALFDTQDIADLKAACKAFPEVGRSLMLDSSYDAALLKDEAIKGAMNFGGPEAIRDGRVPRIFGFDYYENPNIPGNSENLVGFACHQSAILFASAPCPPIEEVRKAGVTYQLVVDPQTGVAFEYRAYGDGQMDTAYQTIECSYGWAKGCGNALKRIRSAA